MNTLTFFLHGTGYHEQGKVKTVISALAEACKPGAGYTLSGPGGKSAVKGEPSHMPGTYTIDPETGKKRTKASPVPTKISALVAKATGWGVDDNLIEMLIQVERQSPPPERINLVGFSRGADACLRFANVMYEFYPHIELNIFAIEPVPGPLRHAEPSRIIPPNVKHYVSTLALHENVALFRPQDYSSLKPVDNNATKVECLPFAGHHGVHSRASEGRVGTEVASQLIEDIAHQQLKEWGTEFTEEPTYPLKKKDGTMELLARAETDNVGLLNKYARMIENQGNYGKMSSVRLVGRYRQDYSPVFPQCFVNMHHQRLFAKTFPVTYQYMLDPSERLKEKAMTELEEHPEIKQWMEKVFINAPGKKQQNYFDLRRDRVDGNHLKVAMAVHEFRRNPLNTREDKALADRLLDRCNRILRGPPIPEHDKESRIKAEVDKFTEAHPNSRLAKGLMQRFEAKAPTLAERIVHDLKAAQNQNILQKFVELMERVLSAPKDQYYAVVNDGLQAAIGYISNKPEKSKEQIHTFLRGVRDTVVAQRLHCGVTVKSHSEKVLDKLIVRAQFDLATAQKSTKQDQESLRAMTAKRGK